MKAWMLWIQLARWHHATAVVVPKELTLHSGNIPAACDEHGHSLLQSVILQSQCLDTHVQSLNMEKTPQCEPMCRPRCPPWVMEVSEAVMVQWTHSERCTATLPCSTPRSTSGTLSTPSTRMHDHHPKHPHLGHSPRALNTRSAQHRQAGPDRLQLRRWRTSCG